MEATLRGHYKLNTDGAAKGNPGVGINTDGDFRTLIKGELVGVLGHPMVIVSSGIWRICHTQPTPLQN